MNCWAYQKSSERNLFNHLNFDLKLLILFWPLIICNCKITQLDYRIRNIKSIPNILNGNLNATAKNLLRLDCFKIYQL